MVKHEEEDNVDYLEKTVLDSEGWIFRNIHGNFSKQMHYFITQNSNSKNEFTNAFFISFLSKWIANLFMFYFGKVFCDIFIHFKQVWITFAFCLGLHITQVKSIIFSEKNYLESPQKLFSDSWNMKRFPDVLSFKIRYWL